MPRTMPRRVDCQFPADSHDWLKARAQEAETTTGGVLRLLVREAMASGWKINVGAGER